jgi:hypothetical protein
MLQVADAVITHNTATGGGNGGGISSVGTLVVQRAIISENAAGQFGAGIYSFGTLSATDTTFDHNVALTTSVWGSGVFTLGNATLTNCTFRNHTGAARGGAVYVYDTSTQATISGSTFDANSGERGGAIAVDKATLHVASSRFTGNAATWGGGVFVVNGGTAVANDTTFRNNNAFIGGAIASYGGNVTVSGSTMSGATQGGYGGGVHSEGAGATLGLLNSTISGNAVSVSGGGVMNQLGSTAQLWDVSVLFNTADSDGDFVGAGGGVYNAADSSLTLANSLVAGNTVSASPTLDDCWGTISTNGTNLFSGLPNCTIPGSWGTINNLALIDPVLQNNGGPTETHALLPGSNAIGSGSLNWCLVVDQRGFARPGAGSACSVGAYEYFPPTLDVDGNGSYAPGFDGLLVLRYLFGWRGDALIAGALGANPGRSTPADVLSWLDAIHAALDVDGNGQRDALTDGVMIVRYLFGLRGAALISGALGPNPTRDASAIEAHIQSLMP